MLGPFLSLAVAACLCAEPANLELYFAVIAPTASSVDNDVSAAVAALPASAFAVLAGEPVESSPSLDFGVITAPEPLYNFRAPASSACADGACVTPAGVPEAAPSPDEETAGAVKLAYQAACASGGCAATVQPHRAGMRATYERIEQVSYAAPVKVRRGWFGRRCR